MILGWGDKETGDCCRRCWGLESVCKAPGGRSGWSWVVLLCAGDASPLIPFSCSPGGNSAVHARPLSGEHAVSRADLAQLGAACPVSAAPGAPRKPWLCWREPSEPQRARPRSRSQPARGQRIAFVNLLVPSSRLARSSNPREFSVSLKRSSKNEVQIIIWAACAA